MKKYVKLFEEFTKQTGVPFIEKLRMFALASDVPTNVSDIEQEGVDASFKIDTKLPGDYISGTTKTYKVVIPLNTSTPYVSTYEGNKEVAKNTIESKNSNSTPVTDIFLNFIEATQLFNDPILQMLADNFDKFKSPEEIKNAIK